MEDLRGPVVPSQLNYSSALPVAISSTSNRRIYYPDNGETFGPGQVGQIRMKINSDTLMDFTHSYFQMKFVNKSKAANGVTPYNKCALDWGVPFISRLQIQSQGQDLEDIQEYHRLHSMMMEIQGSAVNFGEWSSTYGPDSFQFANATAAPVVVVAPTANTHDATAAGVIAAGDGGGGAPALAAAALKIIVDDLTAKTQAAINAVIGEVTANKHGVNNKDEALTETTLNFPLVSMIFNLEKYFPLILTKAGIDVIFHTAPPNEVMCVPTTHFPNYEITGVRFIAHEVQLDAAFYKRLRDSVGASEGVLTLAGTTFKHYLNNINPTGPEDITIATRVSSLKALLSRASPRQAGNATMALAGHNIFNQTAAGGQYQYRVGSVLYPASAVQVKDSNIGEMVQEVRKAFGTIGTTDNGTLLSGAALKLKAANVDGATAVGNKPGELRPVFTFGYDFEGFSKTATQSGINVGDKALNVQIQLQHNYDHANTGDYRLDTYAMCDCMLYISYEGGIITQI